ncbi:MAG: PulJ/GspJ family protein [Rhodoglobus sp.]
MTARGLVVPLSDDNADVNHDTESGFSLMELLVAVSIFTIFITIVLTTTVAIAQNATRTQLIAESTNSSLVVFGRLDRQARYADSINFPGEGVSGSRYIEFRTPSTSSASGETMCTQWRYNPSAARLEWRQWVDDNPATLPSTFTTAMNNVINDTSKPTYPFALLRADSTSMQRMTVSISSGNEFMDVGADVNSVFSARNSSASSSPSNDDFDADGESDDPICQLSGVVIRP